MKAIRLEILRHGPAHNQLLSPLTPYLALCQNNQAVRVELPFEHADFVERIRALQYDTKADRLRRSELDAIARDLTALIQKVPGLIAELNQGAGSEGIQLRLVLSANELALLPFELALVPEGVVGAGQPLLLFGAKPVCITREVRRGPVEPATWPSSGFRLLLASAAPNETVPLAEHQKVLEDLLEPWLGAFDNDDEKRALLAGHLTVLPEASLDQIETHCKQHRYTHVHILAHGVPVKQGDDRRYGLDFWGSGGEREIVEGDRLARSLRPTGAGDYRGPMVVTLAACNSGDTGTVVGAGASVAHALHEGGIPLVVAAQFPLSKQGSVVLTRVLYEGLLWGDDPRETLVEARRALNTRVPSKHDWAAIVTYASLPKRLDAQLQWVRMKRAHQSLKAQLSRADQAIRRDADKKELERRRKSLEEVHNRFEKYVREANGGAEEYGLLGSGKKQAAHLLLEMKKDAWESLRIARDYYAEAAALDLKQGWPQVQALVLTAVLHQQDRRELVTRDSWELARIVSEREVADIKRRKAWSYGNLLELYLIAGLVQDGSPLEPAEAEQRARSYAKEFRNYQGITREEIEATQRQLSRYSEFFARLNPEFAPIAVLANQLLS